MTNLDVHFSSDSSEWGTPWELWHLLDEEFHFGLDACASKHNKKCSRYISADRDALSDDTCWMTLGAGANIYMNPPYGRELPKWIKKAYTEALKGCRVVCLVPARTDTKYWHDYIMKAAEIRFFKGRLRFQGAESGAPFPSALVIFDWKVHEWPRFDTMDAPKPVKYVPKTAEKLTMASPRKLRVRRHGKGRSEGPAQGRQEGKRVLRCKRGRRA